MSERLNETLVLYTFLHVNTSIYLKIILFLKFVAKGVLLINLKTSVLVCNVGNMKNMINTKVKLSLSSLLHLNLEKSFWVLYQYLRLAYCFISVKHLSLWNIQPVSVIIVYIQISSAPSSEALSLNYFVSDESSSSTILL